MRDNIFNDLFYPIYSENQNYDTNAKSYYDYLAKVNRFLEYIVKVLNNITNMEYLESNTIKWDNNISFDLENDEINTIKSLVKLSKDSLNMEFSNLVKKNYVIFNAIKENEDGIFVKDYSEVIKSIDLQLGILQKNIDDILIEYDDGILGTLKDFRIFDKTIIEKMKNEFEERGGNVKWYGAKENDSSFDNSKIFEEALKENNSIYLKQNSTYYFTKNFEVGENKKIIGNNATLIFVDCDGIKINNYFTNLVKIENLNIQSNSFKSEKERENIALLVSRDKTLEHNTWGAKVLLENINIEGFKYGILCKDAYNVTFENCYIQKCDIGVSLDKNSYFSNNINFNKLNVMYNYIGVETKNLIGLNSDLLTLESNKVGLLIHDYTRGATFNTTWLEKNDKHIVFGRLNEDLSYTISPKTRQGGLNSGIHFSNTRYSRDRGDNEPPLIENQFLNSYPISDNFAGNGNEIEKLLMNQITYKNIADSETIRLIGNLKGLSEYNYEFTPFGTKQVITCEGVSGDKSRIIVYQKPDGFIKNHSYLLKLKVKSNIVLRPSFCIISSSNDYIISNKSTGSEKKFTSAYVWKEVSEIVTITDDIPNGSYITLGMFFNENDHVIKQIKCCDFMAVDLTRIFGMGNEPTSFMTDLVDKYFMYIPYNDDSYTGSNNIVKKIPTFQPIEAKVGDIYFNKTSGIPNFCSQGSVKNEKGEVTSKAKWVNSNGEDVTVE